MNKNHNSSHKHCLNCGTSVKGVFCSQCGQRVRDNSDRSLIPLLIEFFSNTFFFDQRFFISMRYLSRFPGRMTVEFLEGKRKKFISPITLFLFFNLIYFFVNPLSDYSLSLYDQANAQYFSTWTKEWVAFKLQAEGLDAQEYSLIYQKMSDDISKSIMIINVPMIAFFVYLMAFKQRRFYFDSLIFTFHFFSLFLLSWIVLDGVDRLITLLSGHDDSTVAYALFILFSLAVPLFYAMVSIKKFMGVRWYWAFPSGVGVMVAVFLANQIYRFIIFSATLWAT